MFLHIHNVLCVRDYVIHAGCTKRICAFVGTHTNALCVRDYCSIHNCAAIELTAVLGAWLPARSTPVPPRCAACACVWVQIKGICDLVCLHTHDVLCA